MWQKAKIVKTDEEHPELLGLTHWVKREPPRHVRCVTIDTKIPIPYEMTLETNLYTPTLTIRCVTEAVELLPEFAENVPLISWDEWRKGTTI
jgi:hypothetical protein